MKVYEVLIDEKNYFGGVNAISLVDSPAIESDFVALAKEDEFVELAEVDAEKRLLMGAVLIPNKPILRLDADGDKFYIVFSKDTIRLASELFFKNGNQGETTEMHQVALRGNTIVESWIKEDAEKDKSLIHGLDVPIGSWIVSMKIEDADTYNKAKTGILKGFSIEGFFKPDLREKLQELEAAKPKPGSEEEAADKVDQIRKILEEE